MEIEQKKYYQLGNKTFYFFVAQYAASSFIFLAVGIGLLFFKDYVSDPNLLLIMDDAAWGCLALWAVFLAIGVLIAMMKYKTCSIMLDESSLHLVKGVLSKQELAIPYRRIQSVNIRQSFSSRLLGVAHVAIATTTDLEQPNQTGNEANDEVVSMMDYPLAGIIQKELASRAEVEKMQLQK